MTDPLTECRQLIAQLELISQAPAMNLEPTRQSSEAKGGNRPPGGIDRKDDREPEFLQKSFEHFRRRLAGCKVDADYAALAEDARKALEGWKKSPPPPRDSEAWKRMVAADTRRAAIVAHDWNISKRQVWAYRQAYGDSRRAA